MLGSAAKASLGGDPVVACDDLLFEQLGLPIVVLLREIDLGLGILGTGSGLVERRLEPVSLTCRVGRGIVISGAVQR
jgi:hypothetical protein